MSKINLLEKTIGSGFFTGFIPFASGTFGSLAGLLIYNIPGFENPQILISAIIIFTFYGIFLGTKFELVYGKDPGQCTIDEIVGMWITLLFLPKTLLISAIAFFVWRVFDIIKPFPIRKLESLNGGLGIMIDDVIGGIYALITMNLIVIFIIK
ncbi:MAG: phosphatidylglycerophosphatase A [Ignavibacteriales bacterium CG_4_9_14_3_um_filter_30_11]|nr:MAG: phosphatidylglycerophosphatase A [Ignavibacteriales bacterium CG_4_9_14_3_um_filter_30_11]